VQSSADEFVSVVAAREAQQLVGSDRSGRHRSHGTTLHLLGQRCPGRWWPAIGSG